MLRAKLTVADFGLQQLSVALWYVWTTEPLPIVCRRVVGLLMTLHTMALYTQCARLN